MLELRTMHVVAPLVFLVCHFLWLFTVFCHEHHAMLKQHSHTQQHKDVTRTATIFMVMGVYFVVQSPNQHGNQIVLARQKDATTMAATT